MGRSPAIEQAGASPRRIVPLLSLCAFASAASMRICDPLLPLFSSQFGVPLSKAAATATGFALAYGCCQFLFGPLGDRFGKLAVIAITAALASLCAMACALAPTLDLLIAARALAGAFAGASIPLSLAWIGDNVVFEARQPVLARYLIGQMLGMSTGQLAGGALADTVGWRAGFLVIAAAFAVAVLLLASAARRDAQSAARRPRQAGLIGGYLAQSRSLLIDPWSRRLILSAAGEGFLLFGAMALVASFAQTEHGLSPTAAGLSVALFGCGGLIYAANAGRMLGRLGPGGLALSGGGLFALAMAVLALPVGPGPHSLMPLLAGLGYYMLHNTLQNQASQMRAEARGVGFSWFASGLWVGQGIGVAAAALLAQQAGFAMVFAVAGAGILWLSASFAASVRRRAARSELAGDPAPARGRGAGPNG